MSDHQSAVVFFVLQPYTLVLQTHNLMLHPYTSCTRLIHDHTSADNNSIDIPLKSMQ